MINTIDTITHPKIQGILSILNPGDKLVVTHYCQYKKQTIEQKCILHYAQLSGRDNNFICVRVNDNDSTEYGEDGLDSIMIARIRRVSVTFNYDQ